MPGYTTTTNSDVARCFSDDLGLSVVVVDTSNELAGDGDEPHPCIGRAVRLQVRWEHQQRWGHRHFVSNHLASSTPDAMLLIAPCYYFGLYAESLCC